MAAARDTMGGQSGEANHGADAALRAAEQWSGGKSGQPLLASVRGRKQIDCRGSEQLAAQGQFPLAMALARKPRRSLYLYQKCRMRWKPSGRACNRKRRMNSAASRVITLDFCWCGVR